MYRIDNRYATPSQPTPLAAGPPGYFTEGNPQTGTSATIVNADWLNQVQEELMTILARGGITPSKTSNGQVLAALNKLFLPRTVVSQNMTLYVSPTGSDVTGDGLTPATAWQTIQTAINVIYSAYDWNGHTCLIQLADGTYNYSVTGGTNAYFPGMPLGMPQFGLTMQGNPAAAQNVIIRATNSNGIVADRALLNINSLTVSATGTTWTPSLIQGIGISAIRAGWINMANIRVDNTGGMFHARADWAGMLVLPPATTLTLTGSGLWGVFAGLFGTVYISNATVNVTGWSATQPLWYCDQGRLEAGNVTFAGSATGIRYGGNTNGIINTGGGGVNYFPGTVAGSGVNGGQYI